MKSMTGFGMGRTQAGPSQIEVTIRAVNGRFFEPRFHVPKEFMQFESDLKKIMERYFQRGTIDVFVSRKLKGGLSQEVVVNRDLAREYMKAYKTIAKDLKIRMSFHVETLARLPEVMRLEEKAESLQGEKKALLTAMTKACQSCDRERKREGKMLKMDLEKLLISLDKEVEDIHLVREEANQNLLQRFEQKIKTRLTGVEIDSSRLSQEVALQVEKSDINEELTRLQEHIRNYRQVLATSEAQGKKLDFYTQELLREVNTIGSKSSLSKLTQLVVQAKTLVERLREQVQNVE